MSILFQSISFRGSHCLLIVYVTVMLNLLKPMGLKKKKQLHSSSMCNKMVAIMFSCFQRVQGKKQPNSSRSILIRSVIQFQKKGFTSEFISMLYILILIFLG